MLVVPMMITAMTLLLLLVEPVLAMDCGDPELVSELTECVDNERQGKSPFHAISA